MKKVLMAATISMICGGAFAQTSATTTKQGQGQQQEALAQATNAGNAQTINFNSPSTSTSTQTVKYDGPQNINQNVSGSTSNNQTIRYDGPQTVNQNVSGEQTVNSNLNGTQTQIVQGGTNSSMHQTFGTQKIKNTPSVSGPPLTSSNDTCMGSASGSVNAPGFGLSVGKTYTDDNCVMLKNSRELWNMGMKAASMALMCMDKNNREALEMTGFECPQTARANGRAPVAN